MRIKHLYPIALVIVIAIIGITYAQSRTSVLQETTNAPSMMMASSTMSTTTDGSSMTASTGTTGSYTSAEVAMHADASSCWTSINGNVYDVTTWVSQHPGGQNPILSLCGKDGTQMFTGKHEGEPKPEQALASFKIGTLSQ